MRQALEDVKVLDLSRILAMPYCSMMLGDLGAEIIRVERPGAGDETRQWGPPWKGDQSAYYLSINRNKKSITVDFKKKRGRKSSSSSPGEATSWAIPRRRLAACGKKKRF